MIFSVPARMLGLVLLAGIFAGPASAEAMPIDGAYGNVEGCAFYKTGMVVSDLQLLLTPNEVSSAVSLCDGFTLVDDKDGRLTVDALCYEEGEAGGTPARLTITRNSDETYTVSFDELSIWGPLPKCP